VNFNNSAIHKTAISITSGFSSSSSTQKKKKEKKEETKQHLVHASDLQLDFSIKEV